MMQVRAEPLTVAVPQAVTSHPSHHQSPSQLTNEGQFSCVSLCFSWRAVSHSLLLLAMQDTTVTACPALHSLAPGSLILSALSQRGAPNQARTKSDSGQERSAHVMPCWWRCAEGSWDDIKSVSFLFYLSFQGEMSGKRQVRMFWWPSMISASSWHVLASRFGHHWFQAWPVFAWYIWSLQPLSFTSVSPFPSPFCSKLCAPRESFPCTQDKHKWLWASWGHCPKGFSLSKMLQANWPLPKASAGPCAPEFYQPLHGQTLNLLTCRTST